MEKQMFNVGDKVLVKSTGKTAVITAVVVAAYYCYYVRDESGIEPEGYFVDLDLKKI